jgi:hypothetical protein
MELIWLRELKLHQRLMYCLNGDTWIKTLLSPCTHLFLEDQMDHITVITLAWSSADHQSSAKIK